MKKLVLGVLAAVLMSVGTSAGVSATLPKTDITGVVTDNHVAVAGATVTATCQGNTGVDTTDAHGSYLIVFDAPQCPFGSIVKVTAQKGGKSGTSSGPVHGITTKLNLAIVNVSIPEYGVIGTIAAAGIGMGLIAYSRRRQQQTMFQT